MTDHHDAKLNDELLPNPLRRRVFEIIEVAKPGDLASKIFDVALIFLILTNVVAIILESVPEINKEYGIWFEQIDLYSVIIFTIEYALRIWTSIEDESSRVAHDKLFKRRWRYIRSPSAIVDLLAILPFYLALLGPSALDLRILRAFRLLRIFKLTRYSQSMTLVLKAMTDHMRSFIAAITILLVVMLLAASGMYVFEKEAQPEAFGSIPHAMWWAFATLTTVGYGDVTPITMWGKVFGAAITVVGVGMVALPAGILASAFSEQLRMREKMYETVVKKVYQDGVVDEEEEELLEETRRDLEINEDTASRIELAREAAPMATHQHDKCPHCGEIL